MVATTQLYLAQLNRGKSIVLNVFHFLFGLKMMAIIIFIVTATAMDKYSSNAVFLTLILWITTYSQVCSTTTDITSSTTDSMSTTTMQNTNMTVNTSMTNTTTGPVTNSTTTTTGAPGTTDADTLFLGK